MDVQSILEFKGGDVLTIGPGASVRDAAQVLRDNYIGAVIVVDGDGALAGILSERDIAISLPAHGGGLADARVSDIMTADVVTCDLSVTVQQVLDLMISHGFRHLPVVEDGNLVGVISLRDIVCNWFGALPAAAGSPGPGGGLSGGAVSGMA